MEYCKSCIYYKPGNDKYGECIAQDFLPVMKENPGCGKHNSMENRHTSFLWRLIHGVALIDDGITNPII